MSNEVKKEKGSLMNSFLKSSVGKLAILAGAAMSMSSCTSTTYWNSHGYQEGIESRGFTGDQAVDIIYGVLGAGHRGHYHRGGGRSRCSYGTIGNRGGFLGGH